MQLNYRTSTHVTFCLFLSRPIDTQPIFTQNGSNDVDSLKDVPFAVQVVTFHSLNSKPTIRLKCNKFFERKATFSHLWHVITARNPDSVAGAKCAVAALVTYQLSHHNHYHYHCRLHCRHRLDTTAWLRSHPHGVVEPNLVANLSHQLVTDLTISGTSRVIESLTSIKCASLSGALATDTLSSIASPEIRFSVSPPNQETGTESPA